MSDHPSFYIQIFSDTVLKLRLFTLLLMSIWAQKHQKSYKSYLHPSPCQSRHFMPNLYSLFFSTFHNLLKLREVWGTAHPVQDTNVGARQPGEHAEGELFPPHMVVKHTPVDPSTHPPYNTPGPHVTINSRYGTGKRQRTVQISIKQCRFLSTIHVLI